MNRTFIKVLPLAAAVLLATSCSKEDNNNEIVNNGQEKVEKQFKTITVKGNAGKKQGISKISLNEETGAISFQKNDGISFSGIGVSGTGKFIDDGGNFIADLTFTADAEVTDVEISATIGTALTGAVVCETWGDIANYLYETSSATSKLTENGEGEYVFASTFTMVPQIAILKNTSDADATYKIGEGADQTLVAGSILVVMDGTKLTINGKEATVTAGKSYNIAPTPLAPDVVGSFVTTTDGKVNYTISSSPAGLEYSTNGTSWSDLTSSTVQNLSSGATLSFRTKQTSTAYASQVNEVIVPDVSSVQVDDKTFYYCADNPSWQYVAGISTDESSGYAMFTDGDNNRYLIFDNSGNTIFPYSGINTEGTYTYKQFFTIVLEYTTRITYYADDTWADVAGRRSDDDLNVEQGKVYLRNSIICDNDYNPIDPDALIDSNINYQVKPAN